MLFARRICRHHVLFLYLHRVPARNQAWGMPQDAQPRMEGSDVFNRTLQRLEQTYAVRPVLIDRA